jgi:ribosomal protein S18 acetylase RimI-like enzyme
MGVMAVTIRRVESSDLKRLGELHSAVWAELYSNILAPAILASLDAETMTVLWAKFSTRGEDYVQHVAVDGDRIVGFVGVGPGRETGFELGRELYFLVVDPAHRRSGVGTALLKAADADYLWVAEQNRAAQAFYRKMKFYPDSVAREGTLFTATLPEVRMAR